MNNIKKLLLGCVIAACGSNKSGQNVVPLSNSEIKSVISKNDTDAKYVEILADIDKTIDHFNKEELPLCAYFFGEHYFQFMKDTENVLSELNSSIYIENQKKIHKTTLSNLKIAEKNNDVTIYSKYCNLRATAFDKNTNPTFFKSYQLGNGKGYNLKDFILPNIGYILDPTKLEPIKVAVLGDSWSTDGAVLSFDKNKNETYYDSQESNKVRPINYAYNGEFPKENNIEIIEDLVEETNSQGWTGENPKNKHPENSAIANDILFRVQESIDFFDAVKYIIIDTQYLKGKAVTRINFMKQILEYLSKVTGKPILTLSEDGKTLRKGIHI